MNWEPFKLPDGRVVTRHHRDATKGMIGSDRHDVAFDGRLVVVTDEIGVEIYRGPVTPASGTGRRKAQQATTATGGVRGGTGERFATFNTFVDQIMRDLSPVEALVWVVMFRDSRDGQCKASSQDLARRTGRSLRAVKDAVQRLQRVGLVKAVTLSRHKGYASTYAVNTQPHTCSGALADRAGERRRPTGATAAPVATPST